MKMEAQGAIARRNIYYIGMLLSEILLLLQEQGIFVAHDRPIKVWYYLSPPPSPPLSVSGQAVGRGNFRSNDHAPGQSQDACISRSPFPGDGRERTRVMKRDDGGNDGGSGSDSGDPPPLPCLPSEMIIHSKMEVRCLCLGRVEGGEGRKEDSEGKKRSEGSVGRKEVKGRREDGSEGREDGSEGRMKEGKEGRMTGEREMKGRKESRKEGSQGRKHKPRKRKGVKEGSQGRKEGWQ